MNNPSTDRLISSPHTHIQNSVSSVMLKVIIALIPGILVSMANLGVGILINCILAVLFAVLAEALLLKIKQQDVIPNLKDGSAVVTGLLFALCLSPYTPWWVSFLGISFAIVISKQLFGGLGNNPFNPAMAGYAFVLLCFPLYMAYWPDISGLAEDNTDISQFQIIFSGLPIDIDAISGATPLSHMKIELGLMTMVSEIQSNPLYGSFGGKGWEWIGVAYLAGGIFLIMNKVIRWQIPVYLLGSLFLISLIFNFIDSDVYPSTLFHLFTGGTMLCAFFIATDPASSSTTPRGKMIYAFGIAFFIFLIRTWGGYPDGIAFAVLIMNALVPLIDYYTRPKIMGEK